MLLLLSLSPPLLPPLVERAPTRLRAGVRRTGVLDPESRSEDPSPFEAVGAGSGALSGAGVDVTAVSGAEFESETVEDAVRRVGVRRRVVVREPVVREPEVRDVDREAAGLRRVVVLRPLSSVVDSSATSGSGVVALELTGLELDEERVVRVRRAGAELELLEPVVARRLRSDQSPVK